MSQVTATYGFILTCKICGREIMVGQTKEFEESGTGWKTAYYDPNTAHIAGVSNDTGDSFECILCHVIQWAKSKGDNHDEVIKK